MVSLWLAMGHTTHRPQLLFKNVSVVFLIPIKVPVTIYNFYLKENQKRQGDSS